MPKIYQAGNLWVVIGELDLTPIRWNSFSMKEGNLISINTIRIHY